MEVRSAPKSGTSREWLIQMMVVAHWAFHFGSKTIGEDRAAPGGVEVIAPPRLGEWYTLDDVALCMRLIGYIQEVWTRLSFTEDEDFCRAAAGVVGTELFASLESLCGKFEVMEEADRYVQDSVGPSGSLSLAVASRITKRTYMKVSLRVRGLVGGGRSGAAQTAPGGSATFPSEPLQTPKLS